MKLNLPGITQVARATVRRSLAASAAGLFLCACAVQPPAADPLTGTRWQLVAIESMADAQPTVRPSTPDRYTLAFGADARVNLQLDCNQAMGAWQASASATQAPGRISGSLSFGALATTRAMCPPGSLEPRLAKSLPYVRGYLVQNGQLNLTLMADGGILRWEPLREGG